MGSSQPLKIITDLSRMPTTIKKCSFILGISNKKVKCEVFISKQNVDCVCKTYQIFFS